MRQIARSFMSVWLAVGFLSLASCVPQSSPNGLASSGAAPVGWGRYGASGPNAPQLYTAPEPRLPDNAALDSPRSDTLTRYLHQHQLPLVGARVLANDSTGPSQVILYGFVATPFGKNDAADKARVFLGDPNTQIENRIKIEPQLARDGSGPAFSSPEGEDPDIQSYETQEQRMAEQQYQQYQNQGAPSSFPMMPLLGMFGSFSGGGSGFGFGSAPYGGYGYGGYPARPGYPPYPGPPLGYPTPYSPVFP